MTKTENEIINSDLDALTYWNEEFGLPEYFVSFKEVYDVDDKLEEFKNEKKELEHEIQVRDVQYLNQFKLNRAIELHFLIEVGNKYIRECALTAESREKKLEADFEESYESKLNNSWNDDELFTRDFDKN
ncbi:MAG: hypothetical protein WCT77_01900 [Bacteroidota bacterium]|jgi:hypothetical protein